MTSVSTHRLRLHLTTVGAGMCDSCLRGRYRFTGTTASAPRTSAISSGTWMRSCRTSFTSATRRLLRSGLSPTHGKGAFRSWGHCTLTLSPTFATTTPVSFPTRRGVSCGGRPRRIGRCRTSFCRPLRSLCGRHAVVADALSFSGPVRLALEPRRTRQYRLVGIFFRHFLKT